MPKYIKMTTKYSKEYNFDDDVSAKIPLLEFSVGSLGLSRKQALIELGFPEDEIDRMMDERLAEDLIQDDRNIKAMAGKLAAQMIVEKDGQAD